ncbi:hypothetical protein MGN70_014289 [Eutypa lata]|uniref:DUF202 domain-containing protein n=1 Tax=Eutypa lata (strain UCR-EL1) TaxID=1287681 RepID=M7SBX7_EUTLA|nr:hypothetical protein UCREL1_11430 [Eutypa lata UCREL1]KAI1244417.1 hypothetical protein MGN70_014289 [Eutypa lata]
MPATSSLNDPEEGDAATCLGVFSCSNLTRPVPVSDCSSPLEEAEPNSFWTWPFIGPLLFENESSDARDHCANERTFLSYLRLSIYMAILAVAITLSFHLKSRPSDVELRMALPLGLVFWVLAVACLAMGLGNYIKTVNKYSRRAALVQTGWRTQSIISLIAIAIIATCVVLLVVAKVKVDVECDSAFFDKRCAQNAMNYYIRGLAVVT